MMKNILYVYQDIGVSEQSLRHTIYTLKQMIDNMYEIKTIDSLNILKGEWHKDAALLIMPGGADVHYANQLNGIGNMIIKDYVANGGRYLGICAGAYYGSSMIEFDSKGPLRIVEKRELAFFPNKAIGPVLAKYDYNNNSGSRAALIKLNQNLRYRELLVYYNGGPYFSSVFKYQNIDVIANYQIYSKLLPAVIEIKYDKGVVVLSGIHFEYCTQLMDLNDKYHKNIIPYLNTNKPGILKLYKYILKQLGIVTSV